MILSAPTSVHERCHTLPRPSTLNPQRAATFSLQPPAFARLYILGGLDLLRSLPGPVPSRLLPLPFNLQPRYLPLGPATNLPIRDQPGPKGTQRVPPGPKHYFFSRRPGQLGEQTNKRSISAVAPSLTSSPTSLRSLCSFAAIRMLRARFSIKPNQTKSNQNKPNQG